MYTRKLPTSSPLQVTTLGARSAGPPTTVCVTQDAHPPQGKLTHFFIYFFFIAFIAFTFFIPFFIPFFIAFTSFITYFLANFGSTVFSSRVEAGLV